MDRINILHLRSSAGIFGAEEVILNLARKLEQLGCKNYIACINNRKNPHTELVTVAKNAGLEAFSIDCQGQFDWQTVNELARILRENNIQIIQTHGYKENFLGYLAAQKAGAKSIAMVHGWTGHNLKVKIYELLDKIILNFFNQVVVVSQALKDRLVQIGISPEKIAVVPNAVDMSGYTQHSASGNGKLRDELGIGAEQKIIGTIGRLSKEKGHKYLLSAATDLLKGNPSIKFVFVGDGPERENLVMRAKRLGIENKVIFTGYRKDLPEFFAAFDIFVLPSLREGLPCTLLAALTQRRPVVASAVGGVGELVKHKQTGFLVKPKDIQGLIQGMFYFLNNQAEAKKIAENGYQLVKANYSLAISAKKMEKIYRGLLRDDSLDA